MLHGVKNKRVEAPGQGTRAAEKTVAWTEWARSSLLDSVHMYI